MEREREVLARRRQDLHVLHPSDLAKRSWTPVGPGAYGRFMEIRTLTSGSTSETSRHHFVARPTTREQGQRSHWQKSRDCRLIVGKKVGLPDGRSIVFHLSGPLARTSPSS